MTMRNRRRFTVRRGGVEGKPILETQQTTSRQEGGLEDVENRDLTADQVGQVIHNDDEIGGVDGETGEVLHKDNASQKCATCRNLVGPRREVHLFGNVYCRKHGRRVILVWTIVAVVIIALAALVLSRGCGPIYL